MRVVVLGSVGVVDASSVVPSGEVARRVLAVLAAEANRPVYPDRLADLVWPGGHRRGGNSLQAHISRWRKALGAHRITYSSAGYTLVVGPDELDALGFEELARAVLAARAEGGLTATLELCEQALALWQGPAFAALADDGCVRSRRIELEATHAGLRLARLETLCETGAHGQVIHEGVGIVEIEPWNEPVHRVLARAHYGRGDQVAALRVLADLEERLRNELGLDLGTSSQLLREQVLRQEPALDVIPKASGARPAPAGRMADRIAELPASTQRIMRAAALSGLEVDTAQIGRLLAIDGPSMANALVPALAAGIIVRTDEGVRFAGPGVHDAVATLVPAGEALKLHRRLGEALLARGGGGGRALRAADHLAAAAPVDSTTALHAVDLDRGLAQTAMSQGQYADAVRHIRRALVSAAHVDRGDVDRLDHADLQLILGEALQRSGDLRAAMSAYHAAAQMPDASEALLIRCALAHEECSLHARRHRTGMHDPSVELIERALQVVGPEHPSHVELLASLGQALNFSGRTEQATRLADAAVQEAHQSTDQEALTRTLLRCLAAQDPVADSGRRFELAREAVAVSHAAGADELELEALCAWVPEMMRVGLLVEVEQVISRVEHLSDVQGNVLHRCKVPMWRAALALAASRYDEAEVLIEDFHCAGERDAYPDTARIHGFQSILLALGRGTPARAAEELANFAHDLEFEPWRAATLAVAHASDDQETIERVLTPWTARRFALSRPFAGVQIFCACLVAEAVAACGDAVARQRLAELIGPGAGQNQVLGAGAALLGDAAHYLEILTAAGEGPARTVELFSATAAGLVGAWAGQRDGDERSEASSDGRGTGWTR